MKTSVILGTLTVIATTALVKSRFVDATGATPAAGEWCPGVANAAYDIGEAAGVDTHGAILVESGAAVTQGAAVETDNLGRAIDLATGVSLGRALDAASAAGEFIRVLK
jgi:hypothetical protein